MTMSPTSIGGLSLAVTLFGKDLLAKAATARAAWEGFQALGQPAITYAGSQVSWAGDIKGGPTPTPRTIAAGITRAVGTGKKPKATRSFRAGGPDARYYCARGTSGVADVIQLRWSGPAAFERAAEVRRLFLELVDGGPVDFATSGCLLARPHGTFGPPRSSVALVRRYVGIELWNELVDADLLPTLPARGVGWLTAIRKSATRSISGWDVTHAGVTTQQAGKLAMYEVGTKPVLAERGTLEAAAYAAVFRQLQPALFTATLAGESLERQAVTARTEPWPMVDALLELSAIEDELRTVPNPGSGWAWDTSSLDGILDNLARAVERADRAAATPVPAWLAAMKADPAQAVAARSRISTALDKLAVSYPDTKARIDRAVH